MEMLFNELAQLLRNWFHNKLIFSSINTVLPTHIAIPPYFLVFALQIDKVRPIKQYK